ncbi:cellulase family glycosylhydrolase [Lentzea sp. NBC_00516]|uniref:cellulase family glycosylhydrolase n=1 Tax=Lentzea sp. NBC_00516 TaxID=2903582 RepID=UPI002E807CAA|nr:cellulase family glycosylhydrolase [Lentzea sp. NBC_00516]WUD28539.1 cellulase family glycosylhydrolase [Lentzea sp. NBC_00516]
MNGSRRRARTVLGVALAGLTVVASVVAPATAVAAETGCKVTYSVTGQWQGGFKADVAVTNLGAAVDGWKLGWEWPSGQQVGNAWNAKITASDGKVTATNVGYNAKVGSQATVQFGLTGTRGHASTAPLAFSFNGVTCVHGGKQLTAMKQVAAMEPGWNLGNTLDSTGGDETSWGNPRITEALLDNVKAQGFKSVRLPVTWSAHLGQGPDFQIEPGYLARVEEVIRWALARDLYVLVNIHHDSWQWMSKMPAEHDSVLAKFNKIWTQLAGAFAEYGPRLTFESWNEPVFTGSTGEPQEMQLNNELNASFRDIVRRSGGNNATRLLVLPTLHTSAEQARIDPLVEHIRGLGDPNIAATVHYYGYWPFSVNIAGGTRFDATAQKDITDSFDRVHNSFITRGVPVILGEYGLLGFDRHTGTIEQGEKLKFFEYLGYYARTKKITTMLWDNGQHFGRTTFKWSDPQLFAQIKSSWTTRSGTAYTDQVFNAKSSPITAKTIKLNLNGTSFSGLYNGNIALTRGRDYTIAGDQLTLTASALTKLIGSRGYGVNAVLTAKFSKGVPWRFHVITHDTPVLSGATGTTAKFEIPTAFRGDQLATMEAKYDDGTFAGPNDWTSFKEYDKTFTPNYADSRTNLTPDFFGAVKDGQQVTLTFHYWSGAKVSYHVTKSGGTVTGTTA